MVSAPQHSTGRMAHACLWQYTHRPRSRKKKRKANLAELNIIVQENTAYFVIIIVPSLQRRTSLTGGIGGVVVAAHAVLVASLDVVIEPVQLLPVLGHHRAHYVADGDHPQHPRAVDHRDVSDAVFCADDWHSGS